MYSLKHWQEELKSLNDVQLVWFNNFWINKRATREGRNPKTEKLLKINAVKCT